MFPWTLVWTHHFKLVPKTHTAKAIAHLKLWRKFSLFCTGNALYLVPLFTHFILSLEHILWRESNGSWNNVMEVMFLVNFTVKYTYSAILFLSSFLLKSTTVPHIHTCFHLFRNVTSQIGDSGFPCVWGGK